MHPRSVRLDPLNQPGPTGRPTRHVSCSWLVRHHSTNSAGVRMPKAAWSRWFFDVPPVGDKHSASNRLSGLNQTLGASCPAPFTTFACGCCALRSSRARLAGVSGKYS